MPLNVVARLTSRNTGVSGTKRLAFRPGRPVGATPSAVMGVAASTLARRVAFKPTRSANANANANATDSDTEPVTQEVAHPWHNSC